MGTCPPLDRERTFPLEYLASSWSGMKIGSGGGDGDGWWKPRIGSAREISRQPEAGCGDGDGGGDFGEGGEEGREGGTCTYADL